MARSTFASENVQNTELGAIFEVPIWKNGTPLWREAHLHVKMYKTPALWHAFGPFGVEKASDRRDRQIDSQSVNLSISQ